jgi:hypothetical protein
MLLYLLHNYSGPRASPVLLELGDLPCLPNCKHPLLFATSFKSPYDIIKDELSEG